MLRDNSGQPYWDKQEEELIKIVNEKANNEIPKIYCFGDCCTLGIDHQGKTTSYNYPLFLQEELKEKYQVINLGRKKLRMESLLSFRNLFIPKSNSNKDIACVWCGTNDLHAGLQSEVVFNLFKGFCDLLIEKNIKIIAITAIPRDGDIHLIGTVFEENRLIFNDLIIKNYKNIVDLTMLEKEYYDDGDFVHLNECGYKFVAEKIAKVIKEIEIQNEIKKQ